MANEEVYAEDPCVQGRFWLKVDKDGPLHPYDASEGRCWAWLGCLGRGYGQIWIDGKMRSAHALSLAIAGREIPSDLVCRHTCDNSKCVNPSHIIFGTQKQNISDKVENGRQTSGERHPMAKLTEKDIVVIRSSRKRGVDLARLFSVSQQTISSIRKGFIWKCVPNP